MIKFEEIVVQDIDAPELAIINDTLLCIDGVDYDEDDIILSSMSHSFTFSKDDTVLIVKKELWKEKPNMLRDINALIIEDEIVNLKV